MKTAQYISVTKLCSLYEIEVSFVSHLNEIGLISVTSIDKHPHIHNNDLVDFEKMIRMHRDLEINPEGIDVIFNLLEKVDSLHEELLLLKSQLRIHGEL